MKSLLYILILFVGSSNFIIAQSAATFFKQTDDFLTDYTAHQTVRYQHLKQDNPAELQTLIQKIAGANWATEEGATQKAFLINAYNLLVIHNIHQHFPIASPNEVTDFWDGINYEVSGRFYTLKQLKAHILELYPDERLHFALVDGARGSAPILETAYRPEQLEQQLEQQTIAILNDTKFVQYNPETALLTLPAFLRTVLPKFELAPIAWINRYRVRKVTEDATLLYLNYDWLLNSFLEQKQWISTKQKAKKRQQNNSYSPLAQVITLPKNAVEIIMFNSIFTVTYGDANLGTRNSYYNGFFSAYYGVSGKFDIGVNFLLRSSREQDYYTTSPFDVFKFERRPRMPNGRYSATYADWGLSHMGMQVRFAPFKNINLSFEQGFLLPVQGLPDGNTVDQSIYNITQVYYIHPLSAQWQLFFALTYWQPIQPGEAFQPQLPLLRGFLNYFATPRFSFFLTTMYGVEWGIGAKVLLTPTLELQGMYSYYLPLGEVYDLFSPGATTIMTYNMGLRTRF